MLLPDLLGRETGPRELHLPLPLLFVDVSPTLQPRRPRHAQQTSPTTRNGRHAAFIMFPRSSFDGSAAAVVPGRVEGQWALPHDVGALCSEKLGRRVILQLPASTSRRRQM